MYNITARRPGSKKSTCIKGIQNEVPDEEYYEGKHWDDAEEIKNSLDWAGPKQDPPTRCAVD